MEVKVETINRRRSQARATVIKALAHPSRIILAEALSGKELCVQDLTELVGADISTVSRHLAIMKNAGLVVSRKEGLRQYYRICCDCLSDFFCCVDQIGDSPGSD